MKISRLDHFVLTVASIERTVEFYERVLGMRGAPFRRSEDQPAPGGMGIRTQGGQADAGLE